MVYIPKVLSSNLRGQKLKKKKKYGLQNVISKAPNSNKALSLWVISHSFFYANHTNMNMPLIL